VHASEEGWGKAEKRKKLRVVVWYEKQEMPVARARVFRTRNAVVSPIQPLGLWAPCNACWAWAVVLAK
jgi:hypothetical protein